MRVDLTERGRELWVMVASPLVWAVHFLLSYITASIWCARVALAAYSVVALLAVAAIGWRGLAHHRVTAEGPAADRQRFLGLTTLLLSIVSAIAIVYGALAPILVARCP